jgi:hypothetical protein
MTYMTYARGHERKLPHVRQQQSLEREQAEAIARADVPTVSEKPVAISGERLLILGCRRDNWWFEFDASAGRKPPMPDTRQNECPDCQRRRRGEPHIEMPVLDHRVGYVQQVETEMMAAWRQKQEAHSPRPGSEYEADVLAPAS